MIVEIQSKGLDKVNKTSPPRSVNNDLTSLYFIAMFIGAKNSGKSYGLVKLIKNHESGPNKDYQGNTLPIRTILFCPTANSAANPRFSSLKSLSEDDIILNYSDDLLLDKIEEIANDKQEIEEYNNYMTFILFSDIAPYDVISTSTLLSNPKNCPHVIGFK